MSTELRSTRDLAPTPLPLRRARFSPAEEVVTFIPSTPVAPPGATPGDSSRSSSLRRPGDEHGRSTDRDSTGGGRGNPGKAKGGSGESKKKGRAMPTRSPSWGGSASVPWMRRRNQDSFPTRTIVSLRLSRPALHSWDSTSVPHRSVWRRYVQSHGKQAGAFAAGRTSRRSICGSVGVAKDRSVSHAGAHLRTCKSTNETPPSAACGTRRRWACTAMISGDSIMREA